MREYGVPDYPILEDENMTQERFNEMMDIYLSAQAKRAPFEWSAEARNWAESLGYIRGDGTGDKQYGKLLTKEETVQLLYNVLGGEET